jgi:hypothetical protein
MVMGEPVNVIRVTITVPRDVKAAMDNVEERVNWSAVATEAFQAKLLAIKSKKGTESMDDVVSRLKAAAEIEANEDYQAGHEAGIEWAKDEAAPKQLRRLEELANHPQYGIDDWLSIYTNGANHGIAHGLYSVIEPQGEMIEEFWECALGDDSMKKIEEHDFAKGFWEGAIEVWEAVKGKVYRQA